MTITLQTKSGEFKVDAAGDEPILHAGLRAGIRLPYECATGTCGTCRARVMTGDVGFGWEEAPGASKIKRKKGDVLMCQAVARGDCLLRIPSETPPLDTHVDTPRPCHGRVDLTARLTADVMHVEIVLAEPVTFEAGQFMVVTTPAIIGGRAYSMVNYAKETDRLSFVIKRKPEGAFSDWLFDDDVLVHQSKQSDQRGLEKLMQNQQPSAQPSESFDMPVH